MKDEGCKDDPGVLLLGFGCASASTGASRWPVAEARTHRKGRDVCATRPGRMSRPLPTVGNEAGMCLGINGFTNCAPIADWSGRANEMRRPAATLREGIWVAHTWRCLPCVPSRGRSSKLARIAKGVINAPPDRVAQWEM